MIGAGCGGGVHDFPGTSRQTYAYVKLTISDHNHFLVHITLVRIRFIIEEEE